MKQNLVKLKLNVVSKRLKKVHIIICDDRVDILRKFSVNEKIHCSNDIDTVYYPGLLDSTIQSPIICYACGEKVSDESFIKYIDEKKMHSIVFPTCGVDMCDKNNAKKFIYK